MKNELITGGQILFLIGLLVFVLKLGHVAIFDNKPDKIVFERDCDYQVPEGWKIQTDGKRFVVRSLEYGDYCGGRYLWEWYKGIKPIFADIDTGIVFDDECKAKNCLRRYLSGEFDEKDEVVNDEVQLWNHNYR